MAGVGRLAWLLVLAVFAGVGLHTVLHQLVLTSAAMSRRFSGGLGVGDQRGAEVYLREMEGAKGMDIILQAGSKDYGGLAATNDTRAVASSGQLTSYVAGLGSLANFMRQWANEQIKPRRTPVQLTVTVDLPVSHELLAEAKQLVSFTRTALARPPEPEPVLGISSLGMVDYCMEAGKTKGTADIVSLAMKKCAITSE